MHSRPTKSNTSATLAPIVLALACAGTVPGCWGSDPGSGGSNGSPEAGALDASSGGAPSPGGAPGTLNGSGGHSRDASTGEGGGTSAADGGAASGGHAGSGQSEGAGGAAGAGPEAGTGTGGGSDLCGNGRPDPGEQCDDGNTLDEDDCTSRCTDNTACEGCLANNCPFDPTSQPRCSDFSDQKSRDACYSTYACLVRTECYLGESGSLECYCGSTDIVACKDGNGTGACRKEIDAAFAKAPAGLPVVDSNAIVNSFSDVSIPAGAALNLLQCAHDYCGDPKFGGNWECSPSKSARDR
jgi:cysteine-rich repeat protein